MMGVSNSRGLKRKTVAAMGSAVRVYCSQVTQRDNLGWGYIFLTGLADSTDVALEGVSKLATRSLPLAVLLSAHKFET